VRLSVHFLPVLREVDEGGMTMIIGVPKEIKNSEKRVCMTPQGVDVLVSHHHRVLVEKGAGSGSGFTDHEYEKAGAR